MTREGSTHDSNDPSARYVRANRKLWDVWTKLHLEAPAYDVAGFKAGKSKLGQIEVDEVGNVAGKTLLHLQCHFGLDTLSCARRGAIPTGVDFSPESIAAARALSQELDLPARFVCSDLYELPNVPELCDERFDIVFTSGGVLVWLPDLDRWARVIAHFLKPGGVFYMLDRHPFTRLLLPRQADDAGNPMRMGYFAKPQPTRAEEHGSYADPEAEVWNTAYYFSHSLGEIVTALCDAGLRIEFLHEFPSSAVPSATAPPGPPEDDYPDVFSVKATRPPG